MDPQEIVDEFARSIRLELDFGHEARNAEIFHRNFERDERVVVPRVIRQYSTGRVLTLEFLRGTKVSDLDLEAMRPDERRDDRVSARGRLDDDGVPPRLLPLRSAPREHLRPRLRRRSVSSTSDRRGS